MRPRKPWFRESKDAWFVTMNGKQHLLAKGKGAKAEAEAAFYRLMAASGEVSVDSGDLNVATLCDLFLDHSQIHNKPDTYEWHRTYLTKFCQHYGRLLCTAIKPFHLSRWLDSHRTWTGARRSAQAIVKRAFSWGKSEGLIADNPLAHVKNPPGNRRSRVMTTAERVKLLGEIKDKAFQRFVSALLGTGCRPSEVATVTAKDVNFELGVWVLQQHKTSKKTGKPRVVYLNDEMLNLSRELSEEQTIGPLFRNTRGRPFTRNAWRCRFRQLRLKFPELVGIVAYTARHTFATDALINGVGIAQVATLLGHGNTQMVASTYSHIAANVAHMREAAAKATE